MEVVGDPTSSLAVKNYKYVKNCTDVFLANRGITVLRGFEPFVNVEVLWLQGNRLTNLDASLANNSRLKQVYLANNRLRSLGTGLDAKFLDVLDLSHNSLSNLAGLLRVLARNQYLTSLDLTGNPVAEEDQYRLRVLSALPTLQMFDGRSVKTDERSAAQKMRESTEAKAQTSHTRKRATKAKVAFAHEDAPEVSMCVQMLQRDLKRTARATALRLRAERSTAHALRHNSHSKRSNAEAPLADAISFLDRETTAPPHVLMRWDRRRLLTAFGTAAQEEAATLATARAAAAAAAASDSGAEGVAAATGPLVRFARLPAVLSRMEDEGLVCRAATEAEAEATLGHLQRYDRRTVRHLFAASAVPEAHGAQRLLGALLHPSVGAALSSLCLPRDAAEAGAEHAGLRSAVQFGDEWWVPLERFELAVTSPSIGWGLITTAQAQRRAGALFARAAKLDRRNGALHQTGLTVAESAEALEQHGSVEEYLALSAKLAKEGRVVAARQALAFATHDGVDTVPDAVLAADAKLRAASGSVVVASATRLACLHSQLAKRERQQRRSARGQAEALIDRSNPATSRFGSDTYQFRSWGNTAAATDAAAAAEEEDAAPESAEDAALRRKFGLTGSALNQFEQLRTERNSRKSLGRQRTAKAALLM
jgi:hypothetical protein